MADQDELFPKEGTPTPAFGTDPHKLHTRDATSTSKGAAHRIDSAGKERAVYEIVEGFGVEGCILDDVRRVYFEKYGFSASAVSTVSARFSALERKELIFYPGTERKGASGSNQRVRVAMKFKQQWEEIHGPIPIT